MRLKYMESLEIDNYTVGQEDLIQYIKMSLTNIAHTSEDGTCNNHLEIYKKKKNEKAIKSCKEVS